MGYSPPPFQPEAPKPKSKAGVVALVSGLAVLLACGMCGGLIWAGWSGVNTLGNMVSQVAQCPITFDLTTKATLAYAKENGNRLPKAETWQKDIAPYYDRLRARLAEQTKDVPVFKFSAPAITEPLSCTFGAPVTGIWINKDAAGKKLDEIKDHQATILFYEGEKPVMNGAGVYKERPNSESPKFGNDNRNWIKTTVAGDQNFLETESGSEGKLSVSLDDALTPKGETAPAPPAAPAPTSAGGN